VHNLRALKPDGPLIRFVNQYAESIRLLRTAVWSELSNAPRRSAGSHQQNRGAEHSRGFESSGEQRGFANLAGAFDQHDAVAASNCVAELVISGPRNILKENEAVMRRRGLDQIRGACQRLCARPAHASLPGLPGTKRYPRLELFQYMFRH